MSEPPVETPDPLLASLRELPPHEVDDPAAARAQRQARAAYLQSFEGSAWPSTASGLVGRVAVPVFLACVVGLYMTWAIAAATSLVQ